MTNESILISEVIPATPQRIFSAWMDSAEHSAFTGDEATVVPKVGGEHRAAGGYIQGRTLELNEGSRIVQSWRTTEFPPESPDSRVEITLEPTLGGTLVTLLHTDIPVGQGDRYRQSWNDYYLSRLKTYFSDAGDDDDDDTSPESAVVASAGGRVVSLEVDLDLDEETAMGDLEPTSVAEAPTKVMRTNVKRALAASTRGGAPTARTGDTKTVRVAPAAAPAGSGKAKPARASTRKAAKVAARRPGKPSSKGPVKSPAKAAARRPAKKVARKAARKTAKPAKPVNKLAARRAAKPVKKAAARKSSTPSRKPAKKQARAGGKPKRKGGAKR